MNQRKLHAAKAWPLGDSVLEAYHYAPGPAESMPDHSHDAYQLCISIGGTDAEFYYRGVYHVVPVNRLSIVHPGEIHQVQQLEDRDDTMVQWILYVSPSLMHKAVVALDGRYDALPFFPSLVVQDPNLIHLYLQFCQSVYGATAALEQESFLIALLSELLQPSANVHDQQPPVELAHEHIQNVRLYLEEHFAENITLDQLAQIAHLSPYHLNRVFSQVVGLPPHKYRIQVQVEQARSRLLQGMPLKQVAVETGFADQSHLTRHFKRLMRVTPGQYQLQDRKNVQGFIN